MLRSSKVRNKAAGTPTQAESMACGGRAHTNCTAATSARAKALVADAPLPEATRSLA